MAFFDFLHIFTDLFNAAEKAWKKLEPTVQDALLDGSGIINVISQNLEATPEELFELIQKKFPNISKEKLAEGLNKVSDGFKLSQDIETPDLLTTVKNLQTYFSGLHGKFWESATSIAAQVLSTIFSPDDTPFGKISTLIEFVYRKKIKK
ncbi:hypothetical protein [Parafilimonas sp.]|uniref:hypothetical protein n=1 Tax=Parafilimonas sp. TaxID=1969739 RepID=UPI003F81B97C